MTRLLSILFLFPVAALAQSLTLLLPVSPGGVVHRYSNELIPAIENATGRNVIVEFKPGAAGLVGAKSLAERTDLTIMIGAAQSWPDTDFSQSRDLRPVLYLGTSPGIIVARMDHPYTTFKEYLEWTKTNKSSYGVVGSSANVPLLKQLVTQLGGKNVVEVAYKTGPQVLADVAGRHVDVGASVVDGAINLVESGRVRPLAVFAFERSRLLPHIPTLREQGFKVNNDERYFNNFFLFVNRNTSEDFVVELQNKLDAYLASPTGLDIIRRLDLQFGRRNPRAAERFLRNLTTPKKTLINQ